MKKIIDIRQNKILIEEALKATGRHNINNLLDYMDKAGFYTAPASTKYHGAIEGGLADHSINVWRIAIQTAQGIMGVDINAMHDSIVITSILHDLGKVGQFGKPLYVDNVLKKGISEAQPYKTNPDLRTLPHEIVSCIEIERFIELTPEEQQAIAWHNGLYGAFKYEIAGKETPLYMILHFADMWASRVLEVD